MRAYGDELTPSWDCFGQICTKVSNMEANVPLECFLEYPFTGFTAAKIEEKKAQKQHSEIEENVE